MTTLKLMPFLLFILASCSTQNDKNKSELQTVSLDSSSLQKNIGAKF